MTTLLYFAYGSNMSHRRLRARISYAEKISVARLDKHILRFHKRSKDGSAKCDIEFTGRLENFVLGVIYRIPENEKQILDIVEGLGKGYEVTQVTVEPNKGEPVKAFTYYATDIDPLLKPYHWYKEHVLYGAVENDLPADYVRRMQGVISVADKDVKRHHRELAIYEQLTGYGNKS